jgi:hypothetical protein
MKIKKINLQNGVTIIELVVYMGLMSIVLLLLLNIFVATLNTKLETESTSAVNQDTRYILSKLIYEINNADSVASPVLGASGTTLRIVKSGVSSTYQLTGDNFTITTGSTTLNLNGTDTSVSAINFKNIGNVSGKATVQVTYTVTSRITVDGGMQSQTINTTVGTR